MSNLELKVEKKIDEKKVDEIISDTQEITNEKIENSLNYDALTDEEKKAIDEFNSKIDVHEFKHRIKYHNFLIVF